MPQRGSATTHDFGEGTPLARPARWLARAVIFLLLFTSLQLTWQSLRGTVVERFVVHTCTVAPAAFFVDVLTPSVRARAIGSVLHASGGGLNILNGCDGLEALFLLTSAFCVAPLAWRHRLAGIVAGVAIVFLVNQVRIVALFYAYRLDHPLFDSLHGSVAPIAVILVIAGYFYAWLVYGTRHLAHSA